MRTTDHNQQHLLRSLGVSWARPGTLGHATAMPLVISVLLGLAGCSADPKRDRNEADAGIPDAGTIIDPGPYRACTDQTPMQPAPDLNGRWTGMIVASRFVPATGLTASFYTRTISLLLADVTQTGTDLTVSASYCDQRNEDPDAVAHVVIPDSYKRSLKPFVRSGSYAPVDAFATVLTLPKHAEIEGVALVDPLNDPLPTDSSSPSLIDQDQDGNPGVTIKLSGLVSGDLYVVQREISTLTGIAVSPNRLEGHYDFTSEQNILDSNPASLKPLAAQTSKVDPNTCASKFTFVRAAATTTCDEVIANTTLFD